MVAPPVGICAEPVVVVAPIIFIVNTDLAKHPRVKLGGEDVRLKVGKPWLEVTVKFLIVLQPLMLLLNT